MPRRAPSNNRQRMIRRPAIHRLARSVVRPRCLRRRWTVRMRPRSTHRRPRNRHNGTMVRQRGLGNPPVRRTLRRRSRPHRRNPLRRGTAAVPPVTDVQGTDIMNRARAAILFLSAAAVMAAGCYTQLMTPQEFIQVRRSVQTTGGGGANNAFTVNYNQSCVNCHSMNELNERAEEMEYYGIRSVHNGVLLSSRDWQMPVEAVTYDGSIPPGASILIIGAPLWPTAQVVQSPWWLPAGAPVTTRPRTDGPTRDPNTTRDRSPVYTQPSIPPASPDPAPVPTTTTTTTTTSQPAAAPPAESTRSRDGSSSSAPSTSRTRTDGSTRDDSTSRPR